jgi:NAD(P)-dependent dehydrogenase (short-subunit alcohol dehydrogenase family)
MVLGLSLCSLLLLFLLLAPQVNFLSHWLLAHELLSEQRKRRAKAAKKHGSSNAILSSSSSSALTTASISGSSIKGSKLAAADAAACCGLEGTRLVMLSSLTHHAGSVQWGDKMSANGYNPFTSYALSKICNIIMAKEFQRRFDRWGRNQTYDVRCMMCCCSCLRHCWWLNAQSCKPAGDFGAGLRWRQGVQQRLTGWSCSRRCR